MPEELKQIETLTLRDYIDKEMTKLYGDSMELFEGPTEAVINNMIKIMELNCQLIALQEIAYRLEYGFIAEIGNTSLKHHLVQVH